jgi:hypothetical protein
MVALVSVGIVIGVMLAREVTIFGSISWLLTGVALSLTTMVRSRMYSPLLAVCWWGYGVDQSFNLI